MTQIQTKQVSYRNQKVEGLGRKRVYVTYTGTPDDLANGRGSLEAYCMVGVQLLACL